MLTSEEVTDILGLETISGPDIVEEALQERLESYEKGAQNAGTPKQVRQSYKKKLKELEANQEAIRLFGHSLKAIQLLDKAEATLNNGYSVAVKVYLDEVAQMKIDSLDEDTRLRYKILSAEAAAAAAAPQSNAPFVAAPVEEVKPVEKPPVVEVVEAVPPKEETEAEPEPEAIEEPLPASPVEEEKEAQETPEEQSETPQEEPIETEPEIAPEPVQTPVEEEIIAEVVEAAPEEVVQEPAPVEVETAPAAPEIPCLTLRYKNGVRRLHIFNLPTVKMGRSTSNDFIVRVMPYGSVSKHRIHEANKLLSRYHATFMLSQGQLSIRDGQPSENDEWNASGNGIYINGVKADQFTFPTQEETVLTLAGLPNNPDIAQWDVCAVAAPGNPPSGIPKNKAPFAGYYLKRFGSLHEDVLLLDGSLLLSNLDASLPHVWISNQANSIHIGDEGHVFDLKGYSNKSDKKLDILSIGTLTQDLV